jgi:3-oxoacyl-[acyl-carrier protein] reductase
MDLGLTDKVAWVLGGSSGLGRAAATSLAREGAAVAVSARRAEVLQEVAAALGERCVPVAVDVTDKGSIRAGHERVVAELGPVEVLVANAGGPPPGDFETLHDEALQRAFELTTASAWRLAHAVVPTMKERRSGCLLFLTSTSTKEVIPGLILSNMMRAAVVGMAKTLSKELGPHGVRALCVAPGRIDTPRIEALESAAAQRSGRSVDDIRAASEANIPLGRHGEPSEFGDVVAFLASERASYVSGTTVVVDGAMLDGT